MGEIIPFGKKPRNFRTAQPTRSSLGTSIASIIQGLEGELKETGIELDATLKIQAHLSSLRGRISSNAIATSRQLLKGQSLDDLRAIARKSSSDQWSARPGYFSALVDEILSRG